MVQRLGSYGYENLEPSDSHHFGSLMKHLINKLFVTDGDVKQAVTYWQQALGTCVFYPPNTSLGVHLKQTCKRQR
jgi:hypothetical protein